MTVVVASGPLRVLFVDTPWSVPVLVVVTVVALAGVLLRSFLHRLSVVAAAQLAVMVVAVSAFFPAPDAMAGGLLPSVSTWLTWRDHLVEASRVLADHPIPAPAPVSVSFLVAAAVCLVAWWVDVLAAGARMPVLAGVPLLLPLLAPAINAVGAVSAFDILWPFLLWTMMLWESQRKSRAGRPRFRRPGPAAFPRAALAVVCVSTAAAVGMCASSGFPHLPPLHLADRLPVPGSSGKNTVGFSPYSDMSKSLRSSDPSPVLRYRSDEPEQSPLRVDVAHVYRDGRWTSAVQDVLPSRRPVLPDPAADWTGVAVQEFRMKVEQTSLPAPHLAAQSALVSGTVVGARWALHGPTEVPVVDVIPRSYELRYLKALPSDARLQESAAAQDAPPETLELPPEVDTLSLRQALIEATVSASGAYDKARRIQEWLRSTGGFTYSLELAAPPEGMDESAVRHTALDRFLTSRRGYCVQFATAMVMLARAAGIPARLVSGFRPGRVEGEVRTVLSSDAHAWPELRFEGLGWLRFEPTPAARDVFPPSYAWDRVEEVDPPVSSAAPSPPDLQPSSPLPSVSPSPVESAKAEGGRDGEKSWRLMWIAGLAVSMAGIGARPVWAAWSHWLRRRRAAPGGEVDVEWQIMSERLQDLGVSVPVSASPRVLHREVMKQVSLSVAGQDALARLVSAVELFRYAPAGERNRQDATALRFAQMYRSDARRVVEEAARCRTPGGRVRAVMWPSAGASFPVGGRGRRLS
ncbi:transglutaminase family protein [Austwickia chelonae]|uniref:transglutaminase family protein n=1 Tax=Austwickia chelonae TaxID=100225 RepID=UPI00138B18E2|nr:transglutaminaseTgpA domain-containing protein [Austwickia chelonae]